MAFAQKRWHGSNSLIDHNQTKPAPFIIASRPNEVSLKAGAAHPIGPGPKLAQRRSLSLIGLPAMGTEGSAASRIDHEQ
jgi:hypothetical protein